MKRILGAAVATVLALLPAQLQPASAATNCVDHVCVEVRTDPVTGKVVITAKKEIPGSTPKPTFKPTIKPTPKPTPTPAPTRTYAPRPYVYRYRPYTPRPKPKPTVAAVAAVSLSDQLTQLIPRDGISLRPVTGALAQVPILFSTSTPKTFATISQILGVAVGVNLDPTFLWDFGDGTRSTDKNTSHTYRKIGTYLVMLAVSWGGTWSAGPFNYPVLGGAIVQSYQASVPILRGATRYTN